MPNTLQFTCAVGGGGNNQSLAHSQTGEQLISQKLEVATGVTDQQHMIAVDVSRLVMFHIGADQDILVQVNNNTTGQPDINLEANKPWQWFTNTHGVSNPLTIDWTAIFVTNSSGSTANLVIEMLIDSGPV